MRFIATAVQGAFVIEPHKIEDERGFFARAWCEEEFRDADLVASIVQSNMAVSRIRGTLRGLHYQRAPDEEVKVVRCIKGSMFDVVVDLRQESQTYLKWYGLELNDANNLALYVPAGCATGYITFEDGTAMHYHSSTYFSPGTATGIRFDDPAIGIGWPIEAVVISEQDRTWPYLSLE